MLYRRLGLSQRGDPSHEGPLSTTAMLITPEKLAVSQPPLLIPRAPVVQWLCMRYRSPQGLAKLLDPDKVVLQRDPADSVGLQDLR